MHIHVLAIYKLVVGDGLKAQKYLAQGNALGLHDI